MQALVPTAESEGGFWHRHRRLAITAVVLVAAGIAAVAIARHFRDDGAQPNYVFAAVSRADVVVSVTASGTLSPVVQVDVGSQVSGRIKQLYADYNDHVHAGEVIATIAPELFESAVAQAKAKLASARAALEKAKAVAANDDLQYRRSAKLGNAGVLAGSDVDTALANKRSADAEVTSAASDIIQAKAALEQAKENLAYTTIKSPIDGVVISRNVDVGQTVAASLSAPTLFVIAGDLRKMELHTSVAESDVGQIHPGMPVKFTVDAYPSREFHGTVKQVRYDAQTVSNVVTYDAVVSVENSDLALRPGMTATVDFISAAHRNVVVVPNKALRYHPAGAVAAAGGRFGGGAHAGRGGGGKAGGARRFGGGKAGGGAGRFGGGAHGGGAHGGGAKAAGGAGKPAGGGRSHARHRVVWVLKNGAPAPVRIGIGLSDSTNTEVTSGDLHPGDRVIVGDGSGGGMPPSSGMRRHHGPRSIL